MIPSLLLAGWKFLTLLALGFCLALGVVRYASGKPRNRRGIQRLANTAPSFTAPTGYDPNAETHHGGRISAVADAAIATRWSLVTIGASATSVKLNTATTSPIGVADDTTDTINSDLTIPLNINLFGGTDRTLKVAINSTVSRGDWLIPDTTNAYYGMTDPGCNLNRFGRALQAGVAGQAIEFEPLSGPTRFASGEYTSAVNTTSDTITIAGLLATDFVLVNLIAVGGSEKIVTAIAAAGQINITLSADATSGSTKYNYVVFRS